MTLSDELRAELIRHGITEVVIESVEVKGDRLLPETKLQRSFRARGAFPDQATMKRLQAAVLEEAEAELDNPPAQAGLPVGKWTINLS